MVERVSSKADETLLSAAAERGAVVTARELEDWRYKGWLPRNLREYPGFGSSSSSVPEGALDQLVEVYELRKSGLRGEAVLLTLFVRGFPLSLVKLKTAYTRYFATRGRQERPKSSEFPEDQLLLQVEESVRLAIRKGQKQPFLAMMREYIPGARRKVYNQLLSVLTHLLYAFQEGELLPGLDFGRMVVDVPRSDNPEDQLSALANYPHESVLAQIGETAGLASLNDPSGPANVQNQLYAVMSLVNRQTLMQVLEQADLDDLRWGVNSFRLVVEFSPAFAELKRRVNLTTEPEPGFLSVLGMADDVLIAIGGLFFLLVPRLVDESALNDFLDQRRVALPKVRAELDLFDHLSCEYWRTFGRDWETELGNLTDSQRLDRDRQINEWVESHPKEHELSIAT